MILAHILLINLDHCRKVEMIFLFEIEFIECIPISSKYSVATLFLCAMQFLLLFDFLYTNLLQMF